MSFSDMLVAAFVLEGGCWVEEHCNTLLARSKAEDEYSFLGGGGGGGANFPRFANDTNTGAELRLDQVTQ